MKRLYLIALALFVLFGLFGANVHAATVGTWLTYRDDITVTSGYGSIDSTFWFNGTGATNVSLNLTLPCNVANLSQTLTNFTIKPTVAYNGTYNLTVNGNAVNSSDDLIGDPTKLENVTTLAQMVTAGVLGTAEYLNFTFNCNHTNNIIGINITGTTVVFSSTWLTNVITIKEKDITRLPYVGEDSTSSIHAVNDSFNISSTGLWFPLTTIVFNITYPSHKSASSVTNFSHTTISNNGTVQNYTQYQKLGPYIYDVDEDVDGRTHEVTIKIKGYEALTNCVQWEIDPSENVYDDVFDDLNIDNLDIEYNGVDVEDDEWDWDEDDETLTIEDFTVREGYINNKFVFTWTEPVPPAIPVEPSIWDYLFMKIGPIPIWGVFAAIAIVIIVLVGYAYYNKPKKRKKH